MRWLAATISLKVSAILPSMPRWSPVMRTEKSPDRIACSAWSRSSSESGLPFAAGLPLGPRRSEEGVPVTRSLMLSPERNALLCRLECDSAHKTRCSDRDQQGTAGDAAKSRTWNPAQLSKSGRGHSVPSRSGIFSGCVEGPFCGSAVGTSGGCRVGPFNLASKATWCRDAKTKRPGEAGAFLSCGEGVSLTNPSGLRTLGVDLDVVTLGVPLVDDVVDHLDVALGVERELADHGIPLAALDGLHHLLRIGGAGLGRGLRPHLQRRVGIERVAFRIDVLGLELLDDRLRRRLVARIGAEGEERAFAVRSGDRGELLVGQCVARHQHGLEALRAHLAHDQAGFLMVPADIDEIDLLGLQPRH